MATIFTQNGQQLLNDFVAQIVAHPQIRHEDEEGNVTYETVEQMMDIVVPFGNLFVADDATLALWGVTKQEVVDVPGSITRRQCAKQLLATNYINTDEALAMTKSGDPPSMVWTYINLLPTEQQQLVLIDFAADTYMRDNPLLTAIMSASGASSEDIDNFFRAAELQ